MFPFYFPFLFDFLKATVSDTLGCNDADARVRLIAANYASILENVVVLKDQAGNNELPSAASVAESKVETDASTDSGRPGALRFRRFRLQFYVTARLLWEVPFSISALMSK